MRYHACACGSPGVEPDFRYCGSCNCLKGAGVQTPLGPGVVDSLRPTGEIIVELDTGVYRQFGRTQITRLEARDPGCDVIKPTPSMAADRTAYCPPLPDPDLLRPIRLIMLQRSFGPLAFAQAR